jgi:formylmethanofuran dehydrogenase subunit E
MRRRTFHGVLVAVVVLAVASVPTGAEETGISGQVESTIELTLARSAPDCVQATVTATVGGTRLSVAEQGKSPRVLRTFRKPLAGVQVTVRARPQGSGVTEQTITFGPQGP